MALNGNVCLFNTVMLQSKEDFFWSTQSMIHGQFQIFWESIALKLVSQAKLYQVAQLMNINKLKNIERNIKVSCLNFYSSQRIIFGQLVARIMCMHALILFMM